MMAAAAVLCCVASSDGRTAGQSPPNEGCTSLGRIAAATPVEGVPPYAHIIVIVDENKGYRRLIETGQAPHLAAFAKSYGRATRFYAEAHPSEPNYVALIGGDTLGIRDDDPFYCEPGRRGPGCRSHERGYVRHSTACPHLGDELTAIHKRWKGYFQDLPSGRHPARYGAPAFAAAYDTGLYVPRHTGFLNFRSVWAGATAAPPQFGDFDQLDADLKSGTLPDFALVIPNMCDDMHGKVGVGIPADCLRMNTSGLIRRGDRALARLVSKIQASSLWSAPQNAAIVITFDEDEGEAMRGPAGFQGGRIPTVVITNHGGAKPPDDTLYNHYALLRTIEDALGVPQHLSHAGDPNIRPMVPLFAAD